MSDICRRSDSINFRYEISSISSRHIVRLPERHLKLLMFSNVSTLPLPQFQTYPITTAKTGDLNHDFFLRRSHLMPRGFTTALIHTTFSRIPMHEGSARHRDLYKTTHNIDIIQTSMPRRDSKPQFQKVNGSRPMH